jgi:hypothetical protein
VLDHLVTVGPLRAGLDRERAVDVLWFFNDPAHHAALVGHPGWAAAEYRDCLAGARQVALLDR